MKIPTQEAIDAEAKKYMLPMAIGFDEHSYKTFVTAVSWLLSLQSQPKEEGEYEESQSFYAKSGIETWPIQEGEKIRSAEEVYKDWFGVFSIHQSETFRKATLEAMEEYASQFTQQEGEVNAAFHELKIDLKWLDCIEFEAEKLGIYPSRINDIIRSARRLKAALENTLPAPPSDNKLKQK